MHINPAIPLDSISPPANLGFGFDIAALTIPTILNPKANNSKVHI